MVLSLAVMGVYFFKSTELPKELRERSAQSRAQGNAESSVRKVKMSFPKIEEKMAVVSSDSQEKLKELNIQRKAKEVQVLGVEIDRLTVLITTLEQEIKINNTRNLEIQKAIDSHVANLELLQGKISSLV